jgi:hypothetical protein
MPAAVVEELIKVDQQVQAARVVVQTAVFQVVQLVL